jgi:hypothetical protein
MVQVFDLDQHSKDKEPCPPQVFLILSNIKSSFINHLVPGKKKAIPKHPWPSPSVLQESPATLNPQRVILLACCLFL